MKHVGRKQATRPVGLSVHNFSLPLRFATRNRTAMSPVLVHDTEQEIKDLQAELAAIERKLEEGRMEVDLLQSKQDRSQEGADKQF